MRELLFSISEITHVINVISLFVLIVLTNRQGGFFVALSAICVLDSLGIYAEPTMLNYSSLGEEQAQIITLFWYPYYFFTNMLAVSAIVYIFKKNGYIWDFHSRSVVISLLFLSLVQLARFVDRLLIGSNVLADLYRYSIPMLNISISVVAIMYAYQLFIREPRSNKGSF